MDGRARYPPLGAMSNTPWGDKRERARAGLSPGRSRTAATAHCTDANTPSTPRGNRTPATSVKGWRADRYTMGAGTLWSSLVREATGPRPIMPRMRSRAVQRRAVRIGGLSIGAQAIGTGSIGALAVGATAGGALALGAVAIGRLVVGRATVRRLEIEELEIGRLRVRELEVVERASYPAAT